MVDCESKGAAKSCMLTEHEIVEHLWTASGAVSEDYLASLVAGEPSRFRQEIVDNLKYLVQEMHALGVSRGKTASRIILELSDDLSREDDAATG